MLPCAVSYNHWMAESLVETSECWEEFEQWESTHNRPIVKYIEYHYHIGNFYNVYMYIDMWFDTHWETIHDELVVVRLDRREVWCR